MIWICVTLLALVSATVLAEKETRQAEEPSIDQIFISNFTAAGNGCSQGAAGTTLSSDRKSLYVSFDNYQAYTGPGTSVKDRQPSCDLSVNLTHPAEFQYSITETIFHGYAVLDSGMIGIMQAVYYFSSRLENTTTEARVSGPIRDVFTVKKDVTASGRIWSPCGTSGPLLVRTRISLSSDKVVTGTYMFPGILEDESSVGHTWVTSLSFRKCQV
ncbi:hypothetical protein IFR05_006413 [Cadophora sp. M221]|nr:hypothetical protein IFR05_006413 [Cadophora sp. M221]